MYKRFAIRTLAFLFSISLFGCATLKDYKPKSKEEAAIKNVLVTYAKAWNKGDAQGVSPLLHENFKGPVGGDLTVLAKKGYLEALPKRAADSAGITVGEPQMTITGDKADVKCPITVGNQWHGTIVYHLVKEKNYSFLTFQKIWIGTY